jgi:hypothetical protein
MVCDHIWEELEESRFLPWTEVGIPEILFFEHAKLCASCLARWEGMPEVKWDDAMAADISDDQFREIPRVGLLLTTVPVCWQCLAAVQRV